MSIRCNMRKKLVLSAVLFLIMVVGMSANASAEWRKNSNGTYSYYQNGKLQKNKWIEKDYYVTSKGIRKTGWLKLKNKWYYFSKSGRVIRSKWIKSEGKMYYAGETGVILLNGRHKVDGYYYAFNKRGVKLTGRQTYGGKTYFFGKKTGRMLTNQWVTEKKKDYYYGENGVLVKNQWIGRYCVGATGAKMKRTWKGYRYLDANGKAAVGLKKVGSYTYYFSPETYKKLINTTVTVNGTAYKLDSKGHAAKVTADGETQTVPKTKIQVEKTYYSDGYADDLTLLSAIIYCEAGNQSYTGKEAVGLVIMNRMNSSRFPSKLREVIYQKQQFAPARDGSLTRALKHPSLIDANSKKAASAVLARIAAGQKGTKVTLAIGGKKVSFTYLYFMTHPAYQRLGLSAKYKKIGDHVFFAKWA